MGCICSKSAEDESTESLKKSSSSSGGKSLRRFLSRKDDAADGSSVLQEDAKVAPEIIFIDRRCSTVDGPVPRLLADAQEPPELDVNVNGFSGEHFIAGWPSWLTSVAGDAVSGWSPRRADSFEKLEKIGQGTYSHVYKARDLETGKIVALKKVRFVNMDPESVRFMAREITILRKLDHPNVVKLEGIVTSRMSQNLYLVFEYMDHDLAGLAATPGLKFSEPQVKCFLSQLLAGLEHCHRNGVLHRDIKGSNLLINGDGVLKIGDFGLATCFDPEHPQPMTSRVVTLWYRAPELLLGATEYGVAVDMWSAGCILAEMLAGKPIMPGRTEVEQLHKIFKLCGSPAEEYWNKLKLSDAAVFRPQHRYSRCVGETFHDFPPPALALLESLLALEPDARGTAASALQSDFFTTPPLACEPSSLPKLPPSKEYDVKLREEEARRHRQEPSLGGRGSESVRPGRRADAAQPKPEARAAQIVEAQKRAAAAQAGAKSSSEKYNPAEESVTRFRFEPLDMLEEVEAEYATTTYRGTQMAALDRTYSSARATNIGPFSRTANRAGYASAARSGGLDAFGSIRAAPGNARYSRLDVMDPPEKNSADFRPASTHKKDLAVKDASVGYGGKNRRIHYSGPLVPPGGNMEDMLKEHERQIQQAVRKARIDKDKASKNVF